jgi:hypothetical protein
MALRLSAAARGCLPAELNAMQRACEPVALQQDASFVLSAPTGCGKSVVCALAMLRKWPAPCRTRRPRSPALHGVRLLTSSRTLAAQAA